MRGSGNHVLCRFKLIVVPNSTRRARGLAVALATTAAALLAAGAAAAAPVPDEDPFYDEPGRKALAKEHRGAILRSRAVEVSNYGLPLPARAWQVLYKTKDTRGRPVATMQTILAPTMPYLGEGKRPLLSYQTAIDSLGSQCDPSYRLREGDEKEASYLLTALANGWAVTVSDYEGPRHAYTAGLMAARAVLDGIRATLRFEPAGLSPETPVGLWGYSGGGQATAWTAEQQPRYAPEINLAGVAAGGVPPDVESVADQIDGGPFFGVYFAAAIGLSREFPNARLTRLLNEEGRALKREFDDLCSDDLVTGYGFRRMSEFTKVRDPLAVKRVRRVIEKNKLPKRTPTAPLYIYHAILDELIPIGPTDALVRHYCRQGTRVQYERSALGEHVAYAIAGGPQALLYLADRFAGRPAPSNCR